MNIQSATSPAKFETTATHGPNPNGNTTDSCKVKVNQS